MGHGVGVKTEEKDHVAEFIERVDRLEQRYKKAEYKYVDMYMMPREMMKAVRDELKAPKLAFEKRQK